MLWTANGFGDANSAHLKEHPIHLTPNSYLTKRSEMWYIRSRVEYSSWLHLQMRIHLVIWSYRDAAPVSKYEPKSVSILWYFYCLQSCTYWWYRPNCYLQSGIYRTLCVHQNVIYLVNYKVILCRLKQAASLLSYCSHKDNKDATRSIIHTIEVLPMWNKRAFVFHEEGSQLSTPFHFREW